MKRVLSYEPIREQEVGLLIESISQLSSCEATVVDLILITLTTSVIFRIIFGKLFKVDRFNEIVSEVEVLLGS